MNPNKPKIAIIGGSGLDNPQILDQSKEVDMDTPWGKTSDIILTGTINGQEIAILARHAKGHNISPTHIPYRANIWALKEIGCTHILATTACGSLREDLKPGDFVFIDQFIDFTKHRQATFFTDKVVHTPMGQPFDQNLRQLLIDSAKDLQLSYHPKGTMLTIEGPRFSTKAESKMFQILGADLINMSTVPEVVLANEIGLPYQSIAMVTDYDCWKENEQPVTFELILQRMQDNAQKVTQLLLQTITNL